MPRRSKPSSRSLLVGEQSNTWWILLHNDRKSETESQTIFLTFSGNRRKIISSTHTRSLDGPFGSSPQNFGYSAYLRAKSRILNIDCVSNRQAPRVPLQLRMLQMHYVIKITSQERKENIALDGILNNTSSSTKEVELHSLKEDSKFSLVDSWLKKPIFVFFSLLGVKEFTPPFKSFLRKSKVKMSFTTMWKPFSVITLIS